MDLKDVKNRHAFMRSLQTGIVGRKRPVKEDIPYEDYTVVSL